jgi:hypothetical protein
LVLGDTRHAPRFWRLIHASVKSDKYFIRLRQTVKK